MGSPDSARIFLPSLTLVPSSRTTSGTCKFTSRAADNLADAAAKVVKAVKEAT